MVSISKIAVIMKQTQNMLTMKVSSLSYSLTIEVVLVNTKSRRNWNIEALCKYMFEHSKYVYKEDSVFALYLSSSSYCVMCIHIVKCKMPLKTIDLKGIKIKKNKWPEGACIGILSI